MIAFFIRNKSMKLFDQV